jgi:cellulose synthase operon protein C
VPRSPALEAAWIGLIRSLNAQGRAEEARATVEEALRRLPEAPDLLWAQASLHELWGDFEGAIAIYERLYAMLPEPAVVANNLASLLSTYRDDAESLERAHVIARRLRGSDVPPVPGHLWLDRLSASGESRGPRSSISSPRPRRLAFRTRWSSSTSA